MRTMIIGGGSNSAVGKAHIAAIKMCGKFNIVAAAFSRHTEVNIQSKAEYGLDDVDVECDYRILIQKWKKELDCIVILTPTTSHFEVLAYALENTDTLVIVEKPLTHSIATTNNLKRLDESMTKNVFVIANYLGYPMLSHMKQCLDENLVGRILHVNLIMPQEGFIRSVNGSIPNIQKWRLNDDSDITKLSLDLGIHLYSLIDYFFDSKLLDIRTFASSSGKFVECVDNVTSILKFDDFIMNLWYSKIALGHRNGLTLEIYGSEGSLVWKQNTPDEVRFTHSDGSIKLVDRSNITDLKDFYLFKPGHPAGFVEALSNHYTDILDYRINHNQRVFDFERSVKGMEFLGLIEKSMR